MIYLEDLQKVKEQNEQTIQENNELIAKMQKTNCDLEAENRVFDKLILVEKSKEQPCGENQELVEENSQQDEGY
jgi:hypothetical protein